MISPEQASREIAELIPAKRVGQVSLPECIGMNLAEDVVASEYMPPFDRSPLDGYAFASHETTGASPERPRSFKIVETIPAGKVPESAKNVESAKSAESAKKVKSAVKIMTGAVIPTGYDAMLPQEKVTTAADGRSVTIEQALSPGENIIPRGEDIQPGETVIQRGTYLAPSHIGVLATLGVHAPVVYLPYKVGILVTGSELVPAATKQLPMGKIRSSNNFTLAAAIKRQGQEPVDYGVAADDYEALEKKIKEAVGHVDFLLTTGGVSKGDYDFVPHILAEMGAERVFWRVNMKPGAPIHVAKYQEMPVFSLSGNPAACMATYHLLLSPLLTGTGEGFPNSIAARCKPARLEAAIHKKTTSVWRFIRGRSWIGDDGQFYCMPIAREKPSMQKTLMWSNGYIVVPPGDPAPAKSESVDFIFTEYDGGSW